MPPDIQGTVYKFVPNNPKLATAMTKVLKNVFQVRSLPMELVKQVAQRAFEMIRNDIKPDSSIFEEKLTQYANQLRPRYMAKINEAKKRGKTW